MIISHVKTLRGEISVPGDKSISHRSVMFGALAKGTTKVSHFLQSADCLSTINCFRALGIDIENDEHSVLIHGKGMHGPRTPQKTLDTGNSGTTTRLIAGILSAQNFTSTLNGDASIQKRPMKRIITPLTMMGAKIKSLRDNDCTPLEITGTPLHGITYTSPVASAQVKSSILLAGLYADNITSITEPALSRNHSELMLSAFGAKVISAPALSGTATSGAYTATIYPAKELFAQEILVPGDISSAAYFIVAGLITPGSEITIKNVGINPTRDGILRVCQAMGGQIAIENKRLAGGEPVADITVKHSELYGITIEGEIIPTLIDEIPVIAVLACFAKGTTIIKDAAELKVKESDRIEVVTKNLSAMGAGIIATDDGMIIDGQKPLHGARIDAHLDHRIAMAFTVAAMNSDGTTDIIGAECVRISYPEFYNDMNKLAKNC